MTKRIIIGSDHGGYNLKLDLIGYLKELDYEVCDIGCYTEESCDYPIIAQGLVKEVIRTSGQGILICGTGVGMSIAANRFDGIRASLCTDTYTAKMTRKHNDSNVLCLGERVLGKGLALEIVDTWLHTDFEGERHQRRIDMI